MMVLTTYSTVTAFLVWTLGFLSTQCAAAENHQRVGKCTFIVHPVCPDPSINFYLYTRENRYDPQLVNIENITESYYVKTLANKFILHGFNSNMTLGVLQTIKDEYLMQSDINVWMIDYRDVSAGPRECYFAAVYNLPAVGKCTALFVRKIIELSEVEAPEEAMHVIGFSLGGQLASQLAKYLKPIKLPRITGLDPALPLFYSTHLNSRLNRNDAEFVDVIHTNAMIQGQLAPCGDVDFYVNGGLAQPGCHNSSNPINCDHHMAPTYFAESIRSVSGFWSWPCPSVFDYFSGKCPRRGDYELMGECVNHSARGQYALHTNSEPPYAQGDWTR
ncbi:pancreatic lipase-related protein 2-like isoform X2 [Rhopalosiphum padi]|uniref:pancreatic lipase-related protein 2-like isoform X2 n=1 Tax=Rhopalosiphum padi TaxID=40932 RepID=UPI00298DC818|nr:pancreatic lipase-related protein 2-like isoform X2 [Rhopalosiphum padi]